MSDETYLDYHEVFPTRWEITAAYAICCAKCHETRLAKHFRRQLTRAQAVARGHALGLRNQDDQPRHLRGERLPTVESKFCTKCQPGHYKPTEMTIPEMYKAAYDGKASLARVNIDAERKRKKSSAKISAAVSERWAKWKAAPWGHVRARLSEELLILTRRISYFNTKGADKRLTALLTALLALQETMTALRARCTLNARTQARMEPETTWEDLTGTPTMNRLHALWAAVPVELIWRANRTPMLINKAQPLVMDGYIAPNQDSIDRLNLVKGHAYKE